MPAGTNPASPRRSDCRRSRGRRHRPGASATWATGRVPGRGGIFVAGLAVFRVVPVGELTPSRLRAPTPASRRIERLQTAGLAKTTPYVVGRTCKCLVIRTDLPGAQEAVGHDSLGERDDPRAAIGRGEAGESRRKAARFAKKSAGSDNGRNLSARRSKLPAESLTSQRLQVVRKGGLEPPRYCYRQPLKLAQVPPCCELIRILRTVAELH
jgi:hypothetical protein